jgi:tetratricopeptide (TPR) repeat protein
MADVKSRFNFCERHRAEEALAAYDKVLEIKPDLVEAWNHKSLALDSLDRHKEALTAYDKAIEIKPVFGVLAVI